MAHRTQRLFSDPQARAAALIRSTQTGISDITSSHNERAMRLMAVFDQVLGPVADAGAASRPAAVAALGIPAGAAGTAGGAAGGEADTGRFDTAVAELVNRVSAAKEGNVLGPAGGADGGADSTLTPGVGVMGSMERNSLRYFRFTLTEITDEVKVLFRSDGEAEMFVSTRNKRPSPADYTWRTPRTTGSLVISVKPSDPAAVEGDYFVSVFTYDAPSPAISYYVAIIVAKAQAAVQKLTLAEQFLVKNGYSTGAEGRQLLAQRAAAAKSAKFAAKQLLTTDFVSQNKGAVATTPLRTPKRIKSLHRWSSRRSLDDNASVASVDHLTAPVHYASAPNLSAALTPAPLQALRPAGAGKHGVDYVPRAVNKRTSLASLATQIVEEPSPITIASSRRRQSSPRQPAESPAAETNAILDRAATQAAPEYPSFTAWNTQRPGSHQHGRSPSPPNSMVQRLKSTPGGNYAFGSRTTREGPSALPRRNTPPYLLQLLPPELAFLHKDTPVLPAGVMEDDLRSTATSSTMRRPATSSTATGAAGSKVANSASLANVYGVFPVLQLAQPDSYVRLPPMRLGGQPFSIEMWVMCEDLNASNVRIFEFGGIPSAHVTSTTCGVGVDIWAGPAADVVMPAPPKTSAHPDGPPDEPGQAPAPPAAQPANGTFHLRQVLGSGRLGFAVFADGVWSEVHTGFSVPQYKWFHLAVTVAQDGTTQVYIDGRLAGADVLPLPPRMWRLQGWLGRSTWDPHLRTWRGKMYALRIWDSVRSGADIVAGMQRDLAADDESLALGMQLSHEDAVATLEKAALKAAEVQSLVRTGTIDTGAHRFDSMSHLAALFGGPASVNVQPEVLPLRLDPHLIASFPMTEGSGEQVFCQVTPGAFGVCFGADWTLNIESAPDKARVVQAAVKFDTVLRQFERLDADTRRTLTKKFFEVSRIFGVAPVSTATQRALSAPLAATGDQPTTKRRFPHALLAAVSAASAFSSGSQFEFAKPKDGWSWVPILQGGLFDREELMSPGGKNPARKLLAQPRKGLSMAAQANGTRPVLDSHNRPRVKATHIEISADAEWHEDSVDAHAGTAVFYAIEPPTEQKLQCCLDVQYTGLKSGNGHDVGRGAITILVGTGPHAPEPTSYAWGIVVGNRQQKDTPGAQSRTATALVDVPAQSLLLSRSSNQPNPRTLLVSVIPGAVLEGDSGTGPSDDSYHSFNVRLRAKVAPSAAASMAAVFVEMPDEGSVHDGGPADNQSATQSVKDAADSPTVPMFEEWAGLSEERMRAERIVVARPLRSQHRGIHGNRSAAYKPHGVDPYSSAMPPKVRPPLHVHEPHASCTTRCASTDVPHH